MYDYLIVGAGLYGSVIAYEATKRGLRCLLVEKRTHVGGNIYCDTADDIIIHAYGAHIFHTNNKHIWDYVNQFAEFNRFTNAPIAIYKNEIYNLPFNMNTFYKLWGISTPEEAKIKIDEQTKNYKGMIPKNLEEQALLLVGDDIYERLIKGYTEKQWGRDAKELPSYIIKRLPLRFTYDNNYFSDRYQGIPIGGYNQIIEQMLSKSELIVDCDYLTNRNDFTGIARKTVYTGMPDAYFNFRYGSLEYRSLRFDTQVLDVSNFQGNAVVNYTQKKIPYTRIIEHKHFAFGTQNKTAVTWEYPLEYSSGVEPFYPVNDEKNKAVYMKYERLINELRADGIFFGGRLGTYSYLDMHVVIEKALELFTDLEW